MYVCMYVCIYVCVVCSEVLTCIFVSVKVVLGACACDRLPLCGLCMYVGVGVCVRVPLFYGVCLPYFLGVGNVRLYWCPCWR